jgi:hypothetical protein
MRILVYAIWTEGDRVVDGCQNTQEHQICQQKTQSLTPQKRKAEYEVSFSSVKIGHKLPQVFRW